MCFYQPYPSFSTGCSEFFRFQQHIHEVCEDEEAENKKRYHGASDFFKEVNGFKKERKTRAGNEQQDEGHHDGIRFIRKICCKTECN